jgi:NifU-like protein
MWEYTDKVKEHFLDPHNVGTIKEADAVGEVGSLAKFQTFGCASAIASSSALTDLIKGKTLDEALKVTNKDIADYLGGLPREKMHCSVMGREALEAAINNFRGISAPTPELEGEIVCECFGVTDAQIRRAIAENDLKTVEDVTYYTKAGGGCGNCVPEIERLLAEASGVGEEKAETPLGRKKMTNLQRIQLIQKVIDEEIRPKLQADGGDLEVLDVDRTTVYVSLRGACTSCPSSQLTLKDGVEARLREVVDPEIQVVEES